VNHGKAQKVAHTLRRTAWCGLGVHLARMCRDWLEQLKIKEKFMFVSRRSRPNAGSPEQLMTES
jgi:hypothetical protein